MKNVIRFSRLRFYSLLFSLLVLAGVYVGMVVRGGFNLGIDFTGGLSKQLQIAPAAFSLSYSGEGDAEVQILGGRLTLSLPEREAEPIELPFSDYRRLAELVTALSYFDGVEAEILGNAEAPTEEILSLNFPVNISEGPLVVNKRLSTGEEAFATIERVRDSLTELGPFTVQAVGAPANQEFILKLPVFEEEPELLETVDGKIVDLLEARFGSNVVIIKKTDFIGSVFSRDLVVGAFWSVIVALVLILIYITVRFRVIYAIAAIVALLHDVGIMIGVIGSFQLEVTSATIAAVLTIIGYSLNDTIVIFDRIRENSALMPEAERRLVIDTSITQSLSRTTITSVTTLLAVLAIYIFGTGTIKDFAFSLIIAVIVGTYSSIFIAAPVVLGWQSTMERKKKAREEPRALKIAKTEQPKAEEKEAVVQAEKIEKEVAQVLRAAAQKRNPPKKRRKKRRKR
jgi:preprotein translocase subunit SecF